MKVELIEKAAEIVGDNQLLINIVSRRVSQLSRGSDPYVETDAEMGNGDVALTEIIEGKITWREATEEELHSESMSSSEAPATPAAEPVEEVTITL